MDPRVMDPDALTFVLPGGSNLWNLDSRITKALKKTLQVSKPTLVQSQVVPLVLEGKDVLVRSKTGTGKTLAFLLPLVQKILSSKSTSAAAAAGNKTGAIILVPTKDLCFQVEDTLKKLLYYCSSTVSVANLAGVSDVKTCTADICVSTPGRLCELLRFDPDLFKNEIDTLVVDECDLVLQFGCEQDVRLICSRISRTCQGILCSATLDNDLVQTLKKIVLNDPVTIKLMDGDSEGEGETGSQELATIKQWYLSVPTSKDKDLILFSLLKLGLVVGKTLFFVNSIDRGVLT
ncbi:hypothetical protein BASA81_007953 [Batrachochytrium salamandrivorans]|nr:hypothetical protein BASA81_007953 [Batrachochytrium salamandrivorans]